MFLARGRGRGSGRTKPELTVWCCAENVLLRWARQQSSVRSVHGTVLRPFGRATWASRWASCTGVGLVTPSIGRMRAPSWASGRTSTIWRAWSATMVPLHGCSAVFGRGRDRSEPPISLSYVSPRFFVFRVAGPPSVGPWLVRGTGRGGGRGQQVAAIVSDLKRRQYKHPNDEPRLRFQKMYVYVSVYVYC